MAKTKNVQKKIVVRTVFLGRQADALETLLEKHQLETPQDLIKFLVSAEFSRISTLVMKHGSKRGMKGEEDVPRETVEDKVAAMMAQEEFLICQNLEDIGFLEKSNQHQYTFVAGDPDVDAARGKRFLHMRRWINAESKEEADLYEKGDELTNAVIAFLKK